MLLVIPRRFLFPPKVLVVPPPILLLLNYLNNFRFTRSLKETYRALLESFTQPLQMLTSCITDTISNQLTLVQSTVLIQNTPITCVCVAVWSFVHS